MQIENKRAWVIWALLVLGTLFVFPQLPSVMATHFGLHGEVNGTMVPWIGAFIIPIMVFIILLLFTAIPYIDPLKNNIAQFRRQFDTFVAVLMLFFVLMQATLLAWNLGIVFDPTYIIVPAVGILIFYTGILLPQTKRNFFIGIRTPWTISSDYVWQKTHTLGGILFKILGVIIILSTFVPTYAVQIIIIPLLCIVIWLVVYSYFLHTQEKN